MSDNNRNLTWYNSKISRKDKEKLHGHPAFVVWFTGLSASGKSTIANHIEEELHKRGYSTYVLDGDNIRHGLCSDLGFSEEDRKENIRRIGELTKLFVDAGIIVLTAFISPFRKDRQSIRGFFDDGEFVEVYTKCPVDVCSGRDYKGVYQKALRGEIKDFTGISSPYEEPLNPEIVVNTDEENPMESARRVLQYIDSRIMREVNSGVK